MHRCVCACHYAGASLSSVFNEDEIVAGDLVMVDLDPDMFKMMHDGSNLWVDSMFEVERQFLAS